MRSQVRPSATVFCSASPSVEEDTETCGVVLLLYPDHGEHLASRKLTWMPACAVKYRIRVKGSDAVVAESPEAGEEFVVEKGGPIKAIDVALKDMKKGETASLIVAPECAPQSACRFQAYRGVDHDRPQMAVCLQGARVLNLLPRLH